jgi:2-polyprenyl-3-methyl-5-hydroxy-6-metoxy-1,4-benzoquinol methylase
MFENILRAIRFLLHGEFRRVWREVHVRLYRPVWEIIFVFLRPARISGRPEATGKFAVNTDFKVAFESPDHLAPKGTAENNSTNKKFVLHMDAYLRDELKVGTHTLNFMDLGCSGGQLVADFLKLKWRAVGLEGSDYSLKFRRANWATLANRNLFTCDITKPYQVTLDGKPAEFHLITAWEVMEHMATRDLDLVFTQIRKHLAPGGYFIASTTETSDMHEGLELHQTQWSNAQWRAYVKKSFPDLEYVDVGLKPYQFVRYNFMHPSFLLYRKRG